MRSATAFVSYVHNVNIMPIPVAAPSKAWDCSRSLAGNVGSNPARGMDVCPLCLFELSG